MLFAREVFKLTLNDINKLEQCEPSKRKYIFKITNMLVNLKPGQKNVKDLPPSELLKTSLEELIKFYGRKSNYVYASTFYYINCKILRNELNGLDNIIHDYCQEYSTLFGPPNPETWRPFALYCPYYAAKNDWKKCLEYSKLVYEKQLEYEINDNARLSSSSFLLLSLSKNGQYDNAMALFKKIPTKFTSDYKEGISLQQYRIFSGMSDVWAVKGNPINSLSYQELALVAISNIFDNADTKVIIEANKLREKYAQGGEWKSLRNLEERYLLKPLPKNPLEK